MKSVTVKLKEDLTPELTEEIIDLFAKGQRPKPGPRYCSTL